MARVFSVVLLALSAPLAAQIGPTAGPGKPLSYPNGTTTETGRSFAIPAGVDPASSDFDEGRYQLLVPATHLPTGPSEIIAMNLIPHDHFGTVRYEEFRVTMAHTSAAVLTNDLDANLGAAPQVVIDGFLSQSWIAGDWNLIILARMGPGSGFAYNGVDNLVVDIQASVDRTHHDNSNLIGLTFQTTSSPARLDLPSARSVSGQFGSGAITAGMATDTHLEFVKIGFRFDLTLSSPLQTLQGWSDVSGTNGNVYALGGTYNWQVVSNPPGRFYTMLFWFGFLPASQPINLPGLPVFGANWLPNSLVAFSGQDVGAPGETTTLSIPNDPGIAGLPIVAQALTLTDATFTDLAFTNAIDLFINL